jgi:hypothetical protein
MIPSKAPTAADVDLVHLGESFDFTGGQISRVVYRAAALAAVRPITGGSGCQAKRSVVDRTGHSSDVGIHDVM